MTMNKLSFLSLSRQKFSIDKKRILRHILICQCSKDFRFIEKHKLLLFCKLGFVVCKNINNVLTKYREQNLLKEMIISKDDLVFECFIVFDRCLMNFDWHRGGDFHWYLNSSLNRELTRILDRHIKKHNKADSIDSFVSPGVNVEFELFGFYFEKLRLTETERNLVMSRMNGERSEDFMKKNGLTTKISFYNTLNSIKNKFKPIRDELKSNSH